MNIKVLRRLRKQQEELLRLKNWLEKILTSSISTSNRLAIIEKNGLAVAGIGSRSRTGNLWAVIQLAIREGRSTIESTSLFPLTMMSSYRMEARTLN